MAHGKDLQLESGVAAETAPKTGALGCQDVDGRETAERCQLTLYQPDRTLLEPHIPVAKRVPLGEIADSVEALSS